MPLKSYHNHPWLVEISIKQIFTSSTECKAESACSGAIVGPGTVLSASHCFFQRNPCGEMDTKKYLAAPSEITVTLLQGSGADRDEPVANISIPGFNKMFYSDDEAPPTVANDLAIITVSL